MSKRRTNEAKDLALAIGSLVVEDEPDAVPRNRAQRLALAGHVAPALRRGADVAAQRRVTVEAKDGSVAGYTTVLEVQKALVAANEIEIQVLPNAAPVAVPCERCGLPIQPKPMGSWRPICAACRCVSETCAGFGETSCDKPTPRGEYTPSRMARRHGEPWRCQRCKARKQAADPKWQAANKAMHEDPDFKAKRSAALRRLALDPEWKAKVTGILRTPARRERQREAMRERMATPEEKAKIAQRTEVQRSDPSFRSKMKALSEKGVAARRAKQAGGQADAEAAQKTKASSGATRPRP